MSRRYLILARVGAKLQFLSLTTNADPSTLRSTGTRMLKVWRRPEAVQILMVSDFPPLVELRWQRERRNRRLYELEVLPSEIFSWSADERAAEDTGPTSLRNTGQSLRL